MSTVRYLCKACWSDAPQFRGRLALWSIEPGPGTDQQLASSYADCLAAGVDGGHCDMQASWSHIVHPLAIDLRSRFAGK